ncbi:ABC-type multidrug transport system, ATPase component [Fontibacillus panacisegetis]|uniref:ABC-type multidrug transport system, ATPase component n=1 Tax=Fontibacillus panacisegetis TaxID=670482 RepID=A0A1G7NPN4_9BACL|nr:ABC transporter ATP-binding protein [Fontibacillus panacisegetis]SDF75901.1 ABC-type multidrug transport system, ATPase component [Fontibacillus panacisegetis]
MLEINHVSKQYSTGLWALRDIHLQLKPGIIGLLGPNGAGKSTIMRIIATISQPTEGTVTWKGIDIRKHPDELRRVLGYLPQDFGVYPQLNPIEFLEYAAALKGLSGRNVKTRILELLELLNLHEARKRPIGGFSGGMRQRIGIAQALLNDPELLIIDEPTVGLDPEERMRFRSLLTDLSGKRVIIFSTHIVSDIEATADQIAILSQGHLLMKSDPSLILRNVQGKVWSVVIPDDELQEARTRWTISSTVRREDGLQLRIVSDRPPLPQASELSPNLEDAYLYARTIQEGA